MKIFRNGLCYVDKKDLRTIPNNMNGTTRIIEGRKYFVFCGRENLEYFKTRKDIVDYDTVHFLDEEGLDEVLSKAYKFIDFYDKKIEYSKRVTPEERDLLIKKYKVYQGIYYNILEYKINKKTIDHIVKHSLAGMESSTVSTNVR